MRVSAHGPFQDIKDLTQEDLRRILTASGHPPYRSRQIFRWLYREGLVHFGDMRNLPTDLRGFLTKKFSISKPRLLDTKRSLIDGTTKYLLGLGDGHAIETVYLPERQRSTACVSSQVGCKHSCAFCASSILGFARNLKPGEIMDEALFVRSAGKLPVTHVVFMGIGEPFDNYDNVIRAVRILNDPDGMNIGARRITISTCGLIPGIERLSSEDLQVELSVSLHSADDKVRSSLVPISKRYPVRDLMDACRRYIEKTNRVITFEYVLIKGVNSGKKSAAQVAQALKGMKCKMNLIAYNQIRALGYEAPSTEDVTSFLKALIARGVRVTLRKSRGEDIDAGCGQLRISRVRGE